MSDILQPICAVGLVLGLLGGVLYFLRRRGIASPSFGMQERSTKQLKVMERVPLGAQHALHLVRIGERLILVATAPGSCQILDPSVMEGKGL